MSGVVRGWIASGLAVGLLALSGCAPEGEGTIKAASKGKKFDVIEAAKAQPGPSKAPGGRSGRRGAMGLPGR